MASPLLRCKQMAFNTIDEILSRARSGRRRTVAIPAAADMHTLEAVIRAHSEGVIEPYLIGDRDRIAALLEELHHPELKNCVVPSASDEESAAKAVDLCFRGKAQLLMKGKLDSSVFLRPVMSSKTGLRKGETLSHLAFFEIPTYHKLLAITDSAVLIKPDLNMKKAMLENALSFMRDCGYEGDIKVAVLAAIENVNSKMPETEDAAALKAMAARGAFPRAIVEGPISLDLATNSSAVEAKGYKSPVAGDADLLVLPDIAAANILVKSLKFAKAKSLGCVTGGTVPIALSSRGTTVESKYLTLVFMAASLS